MSISINTIFTKNNQITVRDASNLVQSGPFVAMTLPLSFRLQDGSWWEFPVEPLISISGKNVIVKRNVAKSEYRGTIKERWAEDDFQIKIEGSFVQPDLDTYPSQDITTLYQAITQRNAIEVQNSLFQLLKIHQIVVENYSLPFSKGENVQNFSIDAYSDDLYQLFIDVKKNV